MGKKTLTFLRRHSSQARDTLERLAAAAAAAATAEEDVDDDNGDVEDGDDEGDAEVCFSSGTGCGRGGSTTVVAVVPVWPNCCCWASTLDDKMLIGRFDSYDFRAKKQV